MLCACVIDFGGLWDQLLSLTVFAYNNKYQLSIQMAPYKALCGRRYRSPVRWFEPQEARLLGTDLVPDALDKVMIIQDRLRTAQSRQKSYGDRKVRDVAFMVGERLDKDLSYEEESIASLDRQVRQLRSKSFPSVRVQWRGRPAEASTRKSESGMQSRYPHLFSDSGIIMAANNDLENVPLGDVDGEDEQVEEPLKPKANRRGRVPHDNVPAPPPPSP
ncbi:uncharacterized protein [Nicotiana sylvestris]|uniref:uncharacterized protein n=1 Tax=Nicotiana sylvestris TaxID=4096 RepID=UPI00388CD20E